MVLQLNYTMDLPHHDSGGFDHARAVKSTAVTSRIVMLVVSRKIIPPMVRLVARKRRTGFLPSLSATTPSVRLRSAENMLIPMKVRPISMDETPILLR